LPNFGEEYKTVQRLGLGSFGVAYKVQMTCKIIHNNLYFRN